METSEENLHGFCPGVSTQKDCVVSIDVIDVVNGSQFYISLHTVKDIHVWLSVEICIHCLALV